MTQICAQKRAMPTKSDLKLFKTDKKLFSQVLSLNKTIEINFSKVPVRQINFGKQSAAAALQQNVEFQKNRASKLMAYTACKDLVEFGRRKRY